jgi:uncharacterized protein (TIGR03435 family)
MISELANHLWQSTLFTVAIGLSTVLCRQNHASIRYWLWFSASIYVGRMVVDRTGLTGGYDYALRFAAMPIPGVGPGGGFRIAPAEPLGGSADAVSIFTAVEEQLGLKLKPQTGPVELLVIDRVEHPTPN